MLLGISYGEERWGHFRMDAVLLRHYSGGYMLAQRPQGVVTGSAFLSGHRCSSGFLVSAMSWAGLYLRLSGDLSLHAPSI